MDPTTNPQWLQAVMALSAAGMGWYALTTQKSLPVTPPASSGVYVSSGSSGTQFGVSNNSLLLLGGLGLLAYFAFKK